MSKKFTTNTLTCFEEARCAEVMPNFDAQIEDQQNESCYIFIKPLRLFQSVSTSLVWAYHRIFVSDGAYISVSHDKAK